MRLWIGVLALAAAVSVAIAFSLDRRSPTGLEREAKPPEGPDAVASFLTDSVAWRTWTEDEAVRRLVDAPLKWRGLRGLDGEARIALKAARARAEERIRIALRAMHAGERDGVSVRGELEDAFQEYSETLQALAGES